MRALKLVPPSIASVFVAAFVACVGDEHPSALSPTADGAGTSSGALSDAGVPSDANDEPRRIVFATTNLYQGNFAGDGGLEVADAICQKEAAFAKLTGTFRAWLSDGVVSPAGRFVSAGAPYTLVDGTLVAASLDALMANPVLLAHAIDRDAKDASALSVAFTGVHPDGGPSPNHCRGWSELDASALVGSLGETTGKWTARETVSCSLSARLICFEQ